MYLSRVTRVNDCFYQMRRLASKVEAIYKEKDLMAIPTNDFSAEDKKWTYDPDPTFIGISAAKKKSSTSVSVVMHQNYKFWQLAKE